MGEVISISRVSDLDILSEFDSQCPSIPEDIDRAIRDTAENALGRRQQTRKPLSFRVVCAIVVLLSLVALVMVKSVASHLASGFESNQLTSTFQSARPDWRESQASWAAYIQKLENDPVVVQLREEREKFRQQYP